MSTYLYRINSTDIPTRESRLHRFKQRSHSEITINEYVKKMGNSSYEAQAIETLFNIKGTKCVICLENLNRPTITSCKHIFCNDCIRQSLRHRSECPCCRESITVQSLIELREAKEDNTFTPTKKRALTGFVIALSLIHI